jgi:hypothetical protein
MAVSARTEQRGINILRYGYMGRQGSGRSDRGVGSRGLENLNDDYEDNQCEEDSFHAGRIHYPRSAYLRGCTLPAASRRSGMVAHGRFLLRAVEGRPSIRDKKPSAR